MPRRCSICTHPQAQEINALLLRGTPIRDVAGRFSLSRTTTGNHAAAHLRRVAEAVLAPAETGALAAVAAVQERIPPLPSAATLRDHVLRDVARLEALTEAALVAGNMAQAFAAIRTKAFVLSRAGFMAEPDRPLNGEATEDPHERTAREMQRAMMDFLKDAHASLRPEEEAEEELPAAPVRHRQRARQEAQETALPVEES